MSKLTDLTISEALVGLGAKKFSAVELADAHIAGMEKARGLNAFITETLDVARKQAKESDARWAAGKAGALDGIPLAIKDLYCTKGVRTTAASHILENFVPSYESTVTSKLFGAGAMMLGKVNLDEFAMGGSGVTSYFKPTISPWSGTEPEKATRKLVPGGSSSGSAAAVAARIAMGATGTDTGGSIRQPASVTGTVGMKPTYGRCSRFGIIAFASSLDQAGPMTRSVEDAARMLQVMAGFDVKDSTSVDVGVPDYVKALGGSVKGMKVGLPREYRIDGISSELDDLWNKGAQMLRDAGAEVVEISLPHTKYALPVYYIIAPAEASSNLARYDGVRFGLRVPGKDLNDMYASTRVEGFGKEVRRRILIGTYVLSAGYYDAYYRKAQRVRRLIRNDFIEAFKRCDTILTPASPSTAFGIGEKEGDPIQMYLEDVFTVTLNLAGLPGICLPVGVAKNGLPMGLQLIGRAFDEATLFTAAAALEKAAGYAAKPPSRHKSMSIVKGTTGDWEMVIGLEVHAQVTSQSKLFSGAAAEFGAAPNAQVSFVDAGFPGMLPVINEICVEQAVRTGLGLKAQINMVSVFDRKNYFYADLPNGYQISQFTQPIVGKGEILLDMADGSTRTIGITRLHLEQDAGKSMHDQSPNETYVDLNRAGVALMEIVSEPDMRSGEEAGAYLKKLRAIMRYLGTCDGNMEEGSMRCDVNLSMRRVGDPVMGTRCEIKNVNSIRFVQQAIEYESVRQVEVLEGGGTIKQETRLWDTSKGETRSMRSKEDAHDYRYFPDPDLLPLKLDAKMVADIKGSLPELPDEKKARFISEYGLKAYDASVLVAEKASADFFEKVAKGRDGKLAANWVTGEFFAALNKQGKVIETSPVSADALGGLIDLLSDNTISGRIAKNVFEEMLATGKGAAAIVEEKGLKQVTDTAAIEKAIDAILATNADKVAEYRSGKDKLFGFFVGQVMKGTGGKANPAMLNELLKKKLS